MQEKGRSALSFSTAAEPVFLSLLRLLELADIALPHSSLLNQLCFLHFAVAVERYHSEFGGLLKLVAHHPPSHSVSGSCRSSDLQSPSYTFLNMSDPNLVL